jgi:hypothetical protein
MKSASWKPVCGEAQERMLTTTHVRTPRASTSERTSTQGTATRATCTPSPAHAHLPAACAARQTSQAGPATRWTAAPPDRHTRPALPAPGGPACKACARACAGVHVCACVRVCVTACCCAVEASARVRKARRELHNLAAPAAGATHLRLCAQAGPAKEVELLQRGSAGSSGRGTVGGHAPVALDTPCGRHRHTHTHTRTHTHTHARTH